MELFNKKDYELKDFYLPKKYMGSNIKYDGLTKNVKRRWTPEEIEWALDLKSKGLKPVNIAKYLYRDLLSVNLKLKRLNKKSNDYNKQHLSEKYYYNNLFFDEINPRSVLDLYAGAKSYYLDKMNLDSFLITNDKSKDFKFNCTYNEKAEKLIHKLYYEGYNFDLIDLDPFGSAFECLDLSIKMARQGLIVTLGEMGHKRFKRLDFVRSHYNINSIKDFTSQKIVNEIIKIGARNKKLLIPFSICDFKHISRVYFKIEKLKITEQWNT